MDVAWIDAPESHRVCTCDALDWHSGTQVMTVIVTPVFMIAVGGWHSVGVASRVDAAGGMSRSSTQKCAPFPRLMVSMKLIKIGVALTHPVSSLTIFAPQGQAMVSLPLPEPRKVNGGMLFLLCV